MPDPSSDQKPMTLAAAVAMGVGSMVGAGIFALLGEAAAASGNAAWIAFALGGLVALLSGYSYARLGVRFPSAGGVVEYLVRGFGPGLLSGGLSLMFYFASIIGMAMVAKAFGAYATTLFLGENAGIWWPRIFATALVLLLTQINFIGSDAVGKAERLIVFLKLLVLVSFVFLGLYQLDPSFLAPASYPATGNILTSISLTFFAFTGFGVISNTAEDMPNPSRTLPRAIYLSIGLVMVLYVGLCFAVFGHLSIDAIIASKETALAEAARPLLGQLGFTIMAAAALLSTASSINANLYGSLNITYSLAKHGELPIAFERRLWRQGTEGLAITAALVLLLANLLDLGVIAGLGSAAFLAVYLAVHVGHWRIRKETGANPILIAAAALTCGTLISLFLINSISTAPLTVVLFVAFALLAFTGEFVLRKTLNREIQGTTGKDRDET